MDKTPVPPAFGTEAIRHDGWTQDRRRGFLGSLANGRSIEHACRHVGMSRVSAYALRRRDPAFARAWADALLSARPEIVAPLPNIATVPRIRLATRRDGSVVRHERPDNERDLARLSQLDLQVARLHARPTLGRQADDADAA